MGGPSLGSILVIDDAVIRREHFRESAKVLKKMDRLERTIDHFLNAEQKLFSDWLALTFRRERNLLNEKQEQYRALLDFHNSMIAMSMMLKIDLWQAYRLLKNEEERYAGADDAERLRIDAERSLRLEFAQAEMDQENGFDPGDFSEQESDVDAAAKLIHRGGSGRLRSRFRSLCRYKVFAFGAKGPGTCSSGVH